MFTGQSPDSPQPYQYYLFIHVLNIVILGCSYWNEKGIGCGRDSVVADLGTTALGFRTLRLHGYSVCSGVYPHLVNKSFERESQIASKFN